MYKRAKTGRLFIFSRHNCDVLFFFCFFGFSLFFKESGSSRPINVTEFGQILRTCLDLPKIVRHFLIYVVSLDALEILALIRLFVLSLFFEFHRAVHKFTGYLGKLTAWAKGGFHGWAAPPISFAWSIKSIKYIFPVSGQANEHFCDEGRPVHIHAAGVQSTGRCCMPQEAGDLYFAGQDWPAGSRRSNRQRPSQPRWHRGHGRRGRGHLLLELWAEATEDQRCICRFFFKV